MNALVVTTFTGVLSGCGNRSGADPTNEIEIRNLDVNGTGEGWALELETNVPLAETVREVTLVAYNQTGDLVGEKGIGNLNVGLDKHTLQCSAFPSIVSAKSSMHCEDLDIQIRYLIGVEETTTREAGDVYVWGSTMHRCDEKLPPERVLAEYTPSPERISD